VTDRVTGSAQEQFAGDAAEQEAIDPVVQGVHHADHVGRFRPADDHRHRPVELAGRDGGVGLVLRLHHAPRVRGEHERKPDERGVLAVGRRVRVVDVRVELRRERLNELRFSLLLGIRLGKLVVAHSGVLKEEHLARAERVDGVQRLVAEGVCHERHVPADVVGEDVGVARKRREVVAAGTALVGHEYDAVTRIGELADRLRVALEPAVVLRFSVFDRGVEVEPNEDARVCRKVVDGVESGHGYLSSMRYLSGGSPGQRCRRGCQTSRPQLRSVAYASS